MLPPTRGTHGDGAGYNGFTMKRRVTCSACGKEVRARLEVHPALICHLRIVRNRLGEVRPLLTFEERTTALYEAFGRSMPGEALLRRTEDELRKEVDSDRDHPGT